MTGQAPGVWVATKSHQYEGEDIIGVGADTEAAKAICQTSAAEFGDGPLSWGNLDGDDTDQPDQLPAASATRDFYVTHWDVRKAGQ